MLRLFRHCAEFRPMDKVESIPDGTRGIYALLKKRGRKKQVTRTTKFDVVYIGMSRRGIRGRLRDHIAKKNGQWTHFSLMLFGRISPMKKFGSWRACLERSTARI